MKQNFYPMTATDGTKREIVDGKMKITSEHIGNPSYIMEVKYDGSRYVLQRDETGKAYFTSRNISVKDNLPVDKTGNLYGHCYEDMIEMAGTVLDGEVVAKVDGKMVSGNGSSVVNTIMLSDPDKAQRRLAEGTQIAYIVYDILAYKGKDVTQEGLPVRKALLEQAIIDIDNASKAKYNEYRYNKTVSYAPNMQNNQATLEKILDSGMEGVMLKKISGRYEQGNRSKDRIKVKKISSYDGIIIGGDEGTGKYKGTLGALVIGQYIDGQIKEVCTISGMTDEQRHSYRDYLLGEVASGNAIKYEKGIGLNTVGQAPLRVVEFVAQERTKARYRHPRFIQERADKNIQECKFGEC